MSNSAKHETLDSTYCSPSQVTLPGEPLCSLLHELLLLQAGIGSPIQSTVSNETRSLPMNSSSFISPCYLESTELKLAVMADIVVGLRLLLNKSDRFNCMYDGKPKEEYPSRKLSARIGRVNREWQMKKLKGMKRKVNTALENYVAAAEAKGAVSEDDDVESKEQRKQKEREACADLEKQLAELELLKKVLS